VKIGAFSNSSPLKERLVSDYSIEKIFGGKTFPRSHKNLECLPINHNYINGIDCQHDAYTANVFVGIHGRIIPPNFILVFLKQRSELNETPYVKQRQNFPQMSKNVSLSCLR
jgi:hypothetical protein